jgi:hypothetical protein
MVSYQCLNLRRTCVGVRIFYIFQVRGVAYQVVLFDQRESFAVFT